MGWSASCRIGRRNNTFELHDEFRLKGASNFPRFAKFLSQELLSCGLRPLFAKHEWTEEEYASSDAHRLFGAIARSVSGPIRESIPEEVVDAKALWTFLEANYKETRASHSLLMFEEFLNLNLSMFTSLELCNAKLNELYAQVAEKGFQMDAQTRNAIVEEGLSSTPVFD